MSVNLHLSVTVRGYDPSRAGAIGREVRDVIESEDLGEQLPPLVETSDGLGRVLTSRTDRDEPVILSRAFLWAPGFLQALRLAAERGNGGPCEVELDCTDADEDDPEAD